MRFPRSIEFRLAAWYSLLLMVGLGSLGAVLWVGVDYSMTAAVDDLLTARVARILDFVDAEFGETTLDGGPEDGELEGYVEHVGSPPAAVSLEAGVFGELREELSEYAYGVPDGSRIHIRSDDGQTLLPVGASFKAKSVVAWQEPSGDGKAFSTLETAAGAFRVLNSPALLVGRSYRIQVASSLEAVTATRERLLWWLLWAVPAGVLVSFTGGYLISRAAMRPVERVVDVASKMDVGRLSERIDVPPSRDVVERLAETFNDMLARLEGSVNRLEEFTADASHELRGPVAVIRTTAELALRHARSDEELREDMQEIHDEAARLTDLIEDLLALARADSGADSEPMTDVDLGALARDAHEKYRRMAGSRKLGIDVGEGSAVVRGHSASLRRLLVILLDNAVRHTAEDASVSVSVRTDSDQVTLTVSDTGQGIPSDKLSRVFDRFYRVDSSRNRSKGGFGLGLSIAKWIAESHRGGVTAESEVGRGSSFAVLLPRGDGPRRPH